MARKETMVTATRRYLRECREWLPATHPLAVALVRTAEALDDSFQTSTMALYSKQVDQLERLRPAAGQGTLPGTAPAAGSLALIGPRAAS